MKIKVLLITAVMSSVFVEYAFAKGQPTTTKPSGGGGGGDMPGYESNGGIYMHSSCTSEQI